MVVTMPRRRDVVAAALALVAARSGSVDAAQGTAHGRVLRSTAFPVGTITVAPRLAYVGSDSFVLYGLASAEIHVWVDADDGRVRRMVWVQFERYLPDNNDTYDYSDQPGRLKLGSHLFFNGVRFFNLAEDRQKWRSGSDYEHVLRLLEAPGLSLGPELAELALFRVDGPARRELMIICMEDLAAYGVSAAQLNGTDEAWRAARIASELRRRARAELTLDMK